jgi:hypothetical protein
MVVLFMFMGACQGASDFLMQPVNKTIVITDSDPKWDTRISDINGKMIFLALLESKPDVNAVNISALMKSVYCIGEVTGNKIDLRLYIDGIDYWRGNGDYWVLFALPNEPFDHISLVYASKAAQNFDEQRTYMTNTDFMQPVDADLDIVGVLPF